ncbi:MAG: hypothetical protein WC100_01735 [Sterolibacterium sp.]
MEKRKEHAAHTKWTRAMDLALVTGLFEGLTAEGVALRLLGDMTRFTAVGARLTKLGLGVKGARKAQRLGHTAEQYLEESPWYKPKKAELVAAEQPLINGYTIVPFIIAPPEVKQGAAFCLYAAQELDKAAESMRKQGEALLAKAMGARAAG